MHAHTHILTELPRHACEQKAVTCNSKSVHLGYA